MPVVPAPSPDELRVLVAADDPLAAAALVGLLADLPWVLTVGQGTGDDDLHAMIDAARPQVILWDLGLDPARPLKQLAAFDQDGIFILGLLPNDASAAVALDAGAAGLVFRDASAETLSAALYAVSAGLTVLDPALAEPLARARPADPLPFGERLTPREHEVLQLMAEGLSNRQIASRLSVTDHTAKFHVNSILSKLGARTRTEAAVLAARMGLIIL